MQKLSELFGRDRMCSSDEGSGGAVKEAGVALGLSRRLGSSSAWVS